MIDEERQEAGGVDPTTAPARGGGLRLLAAAVMLPWFAAYGATGVWAVVRAARAAADGLSRMDAGYTRPVTPGGLVSVGVLLLVAFALLLTCGLLLVLHRSSLAAWLSVAAVGTLLTAGSVWVAVRGDLHPALWVLFFFGLAYATAVALIRVVRLVGPGSRGGRPPGAMV